MTGGVEATELPDVVRAGVVAGVEEGVYNPLDCETVVGVYGLASPVVRTRFVGIALMSVSPSITSPTMSTLSLLRFAVVVAAVTIASSISVSLRERTLDLVAGVEATCGFTVSIAMDGLWANFEDRMEASVAAFIRRKAGLISRSSRDGSLKVEGSWKEGNSVGAELILLLRTLLERRLVGVAFTAPRICSTTIISQHRHLSILSQRYLRVAELACWPASNLSRKARGADSRSPLTFFVCPSS